MGHGNHWAAIEDDAEKVIAKIIPETIAGGVTLERKDFVWHFDENKSARKETAVAVAYPSDTPLRYLVLLVSDSTDVKQPSHYVHSAYPFLADGVAQILTIRKALPWGATIKEAVEGVVWAETVGGMTIGFFDPLFYVNKAAYKPGSRLRVALAGLAYSIQKAQQDELVIREGPLIIEKRNSAGKANPKADVSKIKSVRLSLRGAACYNTSKDYCEDGAFRCSVVSVEKFTIGKRPFRKMGIVLARPDDSTIKINLFASKSTLRGYEPKPGDDIEGSLWLQGTISD